VGKFELAAAITYRCCLRFWPRPEIKEQLGTIDGMAARI
jgi:hypothetical protein